MDSKCIICSERPIEVKKRSMCKPCYNRTRLNGEFSLYEENNVGLRYDPRFIASMSLAVDNYDISLQDIAYKYGISRERVRQLFELLYGFKYTVIKKQRIANNIETKIMERTKKRDPRNKVVRFKENSQHFKGAVSEQKVFDICAALNYEIRPFDGASVDLIINGFNVEIKSSHKTMKTNQESANGQYHFHRLKSQEIADFIICHCVPNNRFFVIPKLSFPNCGDLYLPEEKSSTWTTGKNRNKTTHTSKYYQYLEAWHLLKKPEQEIIFNGAVVNN
jgi:hypothetical protein